MDKPSDEQDLSSRKPRRSVIRSLSWKRPSKRTKMEENQFDASGDPCMNTTVGTAGSGYGMSDEDTEDTVFDSSTSSNTKKRKKVGVWKAMKRFFSRRSGRGSKGQPQRSVSDPNLVHRSEERPDVAPLDEVDETPMEIDAPPKKAKSHDSLLSELCSKRRTNIENEKEISPTKQQVSVKLAESLDIDWKASPSHTPDKLLPGLKLSHDKIRVAPRHRRAPSRKVMSSVRLGIRDVTDGNVRPRTMSAGARIHRNVIVENCKEEKEALERERENLKQKLEEEQRLQQEQKQEKEEEQQEERKQLELEAQTVEQERKNLHKNLEQERRQCQKEKQEEGKRKQQEQKDEDEKRQQEKLQQLAVEQEKKLQDQERENRKPKLEEEERQRPKETEEDEKRKKQEQKDEEEKRQEENLELERRKQEKLQPKALQQQKLEQETMEKERLEKERLEQKKQEEDKLQDENRETKDNEELNQYNIKQITDFSDLAESLRASGNFDARHGLEITDVETKEATSDRQLKTSQDASDDVTAVKSQGVAVHQNINIEDHDKTGETETSKEISAVQVSDTIDNEQKTANDFVVSPLLTSGIVSGSSSKDGRKTNEGTIVEGTVESRPILVYDKVISSENIAGELHLSVQEPVIEDIKEVTTQNEKNNKFSPPSSPKSASPSSPVRSRRLVIETPEKVYQKPIMPGVRTDDESKEKPEDSRSILRKRPQSMHSRIRPEVEKRNKTQDDSNLGVAKLTQAFERSTRSKTISCSDKKKKPDVLPKPKPPAIPSQTKSLERNYRFPVTTTRLGETEISEPKNTKIQNNVVALDEIPKKQVEKKGSVSPKKAPPHKPKTLPKPPLKVKPKTSNAITKTDDEPKENIKKMHNAPSSVTNGSVKISTPDSTDSNVKTGESELPSFWARRSVFSPEQKSNSTSSQGETAKEKHSQFIQPKTDICVVCGSKVYQMEKLKVKDNIIHRSCIKCSVCKRLLSVGNFIMSQKKIYCKPHEPRVALSLSSV